MYLLVEYTVSSSIYAFPANVCNHPPKVFPNILVLTTFEPNLVLLSAVSSLLIAPLSPLAIFPSIWLSCLGKPAIDLLRRVLDSMAEDDVIPFIMDSRIIGPAIFITT